MQGCGAFLFHGGVVSNLGKTHIKDIVGKRIGKLVVVSYFGKDFKYHRWNVKCDCGNLYNTRGINLNRKRNPTSSCGCCSAKAGSENIIKHRLRNKNNKEFNRNKTPVFCGYRSSAKRRGLAFSLEETEMETLFSSNCFYCESPPSNKRHTYKDFEPFIYNGIDRIDNSKGYSTENTVSCCFLCNQAKSSLSLDCFLKHIKKVISNMGKK